MNFVVYVKLNKNKSVSKTDYDNLAVDLVTGVPLTVVTDLKFDIYLGFQIDLFDANIYFLIHWFLWSYYWINYPSENLI